MPPKKSEGTGATYAGHEGHVEDANQRLWEVDPSRNVDGTVVDGFESDERDISNPDEPTQPAGPDHDLAVSESDDLGQEKARSVKAEASDAQDARASEGAGDKPDGAENGKQAATGSDNTKTENEGGEKSSAGTSSSRSNNSPASSTKKTPGAK
jgi:hypothetical protein